MWGSVLARTGMTPLEPRAQQLWHNLPALMFMDFWLAQNRKLDLRELARMLGVLWLREDADSDDETATKARTSSNELRIPLACAIEPSIVDVVKKYFGKKRGINAPGWANTESVDLFDSSREDFLKFIRGVVAPKVT